MGKNLLQVIPKPLSYYFLNSLIEVEVYLQAHNFAKPEPDRVCIISSEFIIHDQYDDARHYNDIALVHLPKAVKLTKGIQLVQLPSRSEVNRTFEGIIATISGWGTRDGKFWGNNLCIKI